MNRDLPVDSRAGGLVRAIMRASPGQRWIPGPVPGSALGLGWGAGYDWTSVTPMVTVSTVIARGEASWIAGDVKGTNTPEGVMVLDAGTLHRGWGAPGSCWAMLFVPRSAIERCLGRALGVLESAQITAAALREALLDVVGDCLSPTDPAARARGFARLVHGLTAELERSTPARRIQPPRIVAVRLRRAIESTRGEARRLPDLVAPLGVTVRSAIRAFEAEWGITPHQYRMQLRLRDAALDLAAGHSITATAIARGFSDAAHLGRLFRRQFKATPSAWRDVHAAAAAVHHSEIDTQ